MKKLSCIGICLLLTGNLVSQGRIRYEDWDRYKILPDEIVAEIQGNFKNPENLKNALKVEFERDTFLWPEEIPLYKRKFDIEDDTLRPVLMDICREAAKATGWEPFQHDNPSDELLNEKRRLYNSIVWLGYCANAEAKELLMDIATNDTKAETYRIAAIGSYIQCADAQQTRDALVRFLVDTRIRPYSTYLQAMRVYDESENDAQKREAIVASLIVALAREEHRGLFGEMDKSLAERSKDYATSRQRLAILQRMNKLPPTNRYGDSHGRLDPALASFRFRFFKTNVSTNLTELMARDFKPPKKETP